MACIPVVDFDVYKLGISKVSDQDLQELCKDFYKAFTEIGFVYLKNTGIDPKEVCISILILSLSQNTLECKSKYLMILVYTRRVMSWTILKSSSCFLKNRKDPSAGEVTQIMAIMVGYPQRLKGSWLVCHLH